MIRAVFFDATETLIYLPRGVGWHYRAVAAAHGIQADEDRLNTAFKSAFKNSPPRLMSQGPRPGDDKQWWRALVHTVFAECAPPIPGENFDPFFEALYAHFAQPGVWEVYPDVRPTLQELRAMSCRLAVVSNFDRRLRPILNHTGLRDFFDEIAISSEIGIEKPDPRIFAWALQRLRIAPGETVHAGDHPTHDWHAAQAAGLLPFPLRRPENSLRDLPSFIRSLV